MGDETPERLIVNLANLELVTWCPRPKEATLVTSFDLGLKVELLRFVANRGNVITLR